MWAYRPNTLAYICQKITSCNFYFTCFTKYTRKKYAHKVGHICYVYLILIMLINGMYAHVYATHEVTCTNHSTRSTLHIFDIYHLTNMAAIFQKKITWTTFYKNIYRPKIFAYIHQNPSNCSFHFTSYCQILQEPNMSLNGCICHICPIFDVH